jgi:predicted PurR-regulated permease PerM
MKDKHSLQHKSYNQLKPSDFTRRIVTATAIAILGLGMALIFWYAADAFLLIFGAVLVTVLLRTPANWVTKRVGIPSGMALSMVILSLLGLIFLVGWLLGPEVVEEGRKLVEIVPRSPGELKDFVEQHQWGKATLGQIPGVYEDIFRTAERVLMNAGILMAPIQFIAYLLFVSFITLYFSIEPGLYQYGIVNALPHDKRERGREIVERLASTIRRFLVARLASMTIVWVLTTILLLVLGVPLAIFLGLTAGILTFVPYLGPIVATIPIVLVALIQTPELLLWALMGYTAIQLIEGYVLTPVFQKVTVYVPPAMTLITEVLMGAIFGVLGVVMAAPMIAIMIVLYQMMYRENVLGDLGASEHGE